MLPLTRSDTLTDARLRKRLRPLEGLAPGQLRVHEIYTSVQGESRFAGLPCTFVRTTACHLRCSYCDTPHAFGQGEPMSRQAVYERVAALGIRLVELTGGEPLLQPEVLPLMTELCDGGYEVLLETSGSVDISPVDPRVVVILDLKTPSSGEVSANRWENLASLRPHHEVKLVLGSREDFDWATKTIAEHNLASKAHLLMGVVYGALAPADLVAWVVEARLPVRVQLQMHKYIWDPDARGV